MEPKTQGLHHITAITSDASSAVSFYTRVLGLRLVKKTVNFDDPSAYHLYFGDEKGSPGTLLTFFDWGKAIGFGQVGAGVTHHFAFTTRDEGSLANWKTWLEQNDVSVLGPSLASACRKPYPRPDSPTTSSCCAIASRKAAFSS